MSKAENNWTSEWVHYQVNMLERSGPQFEKGLGESLRYSIDLCQPRRGLCGLLFAVELALAPDTVSPHSVSQPFDGILLWKHHSVSMKPEGHWTLKTVKLQGISIQNTRPEGWCWGDCSVVNEVKCTYSRGYEFSSQWTPGAHNSSSRGFHIFIWPPWAAAHMFILTWTLRFFFFILKYKIERSVHKWNV